MKKVVVWCACFYVYVEKRESERHTHKHITHTPFHMEHCPQNYVGPSPTLNSSDYDALHPHFYSTRQYQRNINIKKKIYRIYYIAI